MAAFCSLEGIFWGVIHCTCSDIENFSYTYFYFEYIVQDQISNFQVHIFFSNQQNYWPEFGSIVMPNTVFGAFDHQILVS